MMTGTIRDLARVTAPEGFSHCVRKAAQTAVHTPVRRMPRAKTILIAAVLLLISIGAIAAITNLTASHFFSEKAGFHIPGYEWGSPDTIERDSVMTVYDCTGEVFYQYEDGVLIAVTIEFHRKNQPDGVLQPDFPTTLYSDMCAVYGPASVENSFTPEEQFALQNALRSYLDPMSNERPLSSALSAITPPPAQADRNPLSSFAWTDKATNTAINLSFSRDENEQFRSVRITLTQFSQ